MTVVDTANYLVDMCDQALHGGSPAERQNALTQTRDFLTYRELELSSAGGAWLVDQLYAAIDQLKGTAPVDPGSNQVSPFWSGVKSFTNDSSSLDNAIGAAATEQAKRLGEGAANAVNAASSGLVKSPALVGVVVVALVLAAAWAYRSFK